MRLKNETIWEQVLAEIELEITKADFTALFAATKFEQETADLGVVFCRNQMECLLLEQKYKKRIQALLAKKLGRKLQLKFKVGNNLNKIINQEIGPLFSPAIDNAGLDPLYTLENFAVSSSNQLAYAAAQAVIRNPGKAYNPLFLWGGVGVGKTHLMQAVGHEILKKDPTARVKFCSGEEFTNEIIEAIKNKTTSSFKRKYRSAQLLLLDDVQFIADKVKVQEEFFHTFVSVKKAGGQIILTSDRPPREIPEFEARLRSRFEAGLIADIAPPNFELRTAIVLIKARQRGKQIPIELARFLAENIDDTRRLEGALMRLLTEAEIRREQLTKEFEAKVLDGLVINSSLRPRVSVSEVLKKIATHFNITLADLKGKKRSRPIAIPRQIAMYLLRTELNLSLQDIGSFLGGRDHTTIMHGVDKVENYLLKDAGWSGEIMEIKRQLWGK